MNPYTSILVNTNEVDMKKIPDRPNTVKVLMPGYERGAGRDIRIGEEAFVKNKDSILRQVQDFFSDRDFVFVTCGLGGGTGTGSIIEAIRLLHANGFARRFSLILTLPRDQEGGRILRNAIDRLQMIAKAMKGLGSILIVDNEKLFNDYLQHNPQGSVAAYLEYSNQYIAETLHEWNVVTAKYNPFSGTHFDSSEWLKTLQTPRVLSLGKCTIEEADIDADNLGTYLPKLTKSMEDGVLSSGYDLSEATRCAVSMVASPHGAKRIFTMSMLNTIEEEVANRTPYADERPVASYTAEGIRQMQVYSVFAGLALPKRVAEIVEAARKLERTEKEDDVLASLQNFSSSINDDEADLSLLLDSRPKRQTNQPEEIDPFADL